jgi:NADH-quinone oxidoreductase subunit L
MLRLYLLTFTGEPRWAHVPPVVQDADTAQHHVEEHVVAAHEVHEPHESPPVMSWPLIVLAAISVVAGFIVFDSVGEAIGLGSGFLGAIEHVFVEELHHFHFEVGLAILSTLLVGAGLAGAYFTYAVRDGEPAREAAARLPFPYALFRNKFYVDDFYQWCINKLVLGLARVVAYFDRNVVNDTGVDGPGQTASAIGWLLKLAQTGKVPNYALAMVFGVVIFALVGYSVKG